MGKQKKKGILVWAVIVSLAVIAGLLSPYLPVLFFRQGGTPNLDLDEMEWMELALDYETAEATAWTGLSEEAYPSEEKGLLFHNGGQFMDCDFMETAGDCRLVGVYCFKFWGQIPVESYFFSDKPFADEESLLAWILPEQNSHSLQMMNHGLLFRAKYFSFAFLDEAGGVQTSLTTQVMAERKSDNAVVNGTSGGSIWFVNLDSGIETAAARGIPSFSTMVDVKEEGQSLIHWEPLSSTAPEETEISISLTDGLERTERYTELPLTVDSSMSEDYGKWLYDLPRMPQKKLTMKPSVEVTNQDELLVMELQHTATVNIGIFRKAELDTGRIRMVFLEK